MGCRFSIPKRALAQLKQIENYRRENHVRLMRFDFHPTENGWVLSEVNSDVPAGMAEGSVLSELAHRYFDSDAFAALPRGDIVKNIFDAFKPIGLEK